MADDNSMTDDPATDGSARQRRALAALILAESERHGADYGTRLPTERQLAVDLGDSRSAIRHAMAELQAEGRVSREVGRGTFPRLPAADGPDVSGSGSGRGPGGDLRTPRPGRPRLATTRRPT